jgi:hypothetical protein
MTTGYPFIDIGPRMFHFHSGACSRTLSARWRPTLPPATDRWLVWSHHLRVTHSPTLRRVCPVLPARSQS